ncbi:hypothetical protein NA57DRAFT_76413 [Rhizodiscina lignyota]|uniref:Uncharacterized protein n=1 Tax=Rhizodiscina lignyota TaxID=1504668 RepID=A0A9P4IFR1_9PEZI|nr:hypothetical protein NA57DRAFT_76413 [Rhizodiscina lignyota]
MTDSPPPLLRPLPRRPFELSSSSSTSQSDYIDRPETPTREAGGEDGTQDASNGNTGGYSRGKKSLEEPENFSRSKSLLNLTSSTLFGIYAPTALDTSSQSRDSEPATPWGTGAETPARTGSLDFGRAAYNLNDLHTITEGKERLRTISQSSPVRSHKRGVLPTIGRVTVLFILGIGYGALVSHLHDNSSISPIHIEGIDRHSYTYAVFWGLAGVALGLLLPFLDSLWWRRNPSTSSSSQFEEPTAADWSTIVRSIGAFVGIAFAIRKLPWQSTLQVSLTLALANPALWYLLDRTKPGFALSALVGAFGTAALLLVNPALVATPAHVTNATIDQEIAVNALGLGRGRSRLWHQGDAELLGGWLSYESVGVATWIASVLFCSCICFGNIGRRMGVV